MKQPVDQLLTTAALLQLTGHYKEGEALERAIDDATLAHLLGHEPRLERSVAQAIAQVGTSPDTRRAGIARTMSALRLDSVTGSPDALLRFEGSGNVQTLRVKLVNDGVYAISRYQILLTFEPAGTSNSSSTSVECDEGPDAAPLAPKSHVEAVCKLHPSVVTRMQAAVAGLHDGRNQMRMKVWRLESVEPDVGITELGLQYPGGRRAMNAAADLIAHSTCQERASCDQDTKRAAKRAHDQRIDAAKYLWDRMVWLVTVRPDWVVWLTLYLTLAAIPIFYGILCKKMSFFFSQLYFGYWTFSLLAAGLSMFVDSPGSGGWSGFFGVSAALFLGVPWNSSLKFVGQIQAGLQPYFSDPKAAELLSVWAGVAINQVILGLLAFSRIWRADSKQT